MGRRNEEEWRRAGPWPTLERGQLVAAAEALAAARPDVQAVYLFGSRARGRTHPNSDVDLAVLSEPPVPVSERISTREKLARFLEDRLAAPVDVVLLHRDLAPGLLFDIFA